MKKTILLISGAIFVFSISLRAYSEEKAVKHVRLWMKDGAVEKLHEQLKNYSGKDYQIIPYKVEGGGVARPEGYIMIDLPSVAVAEEVLVGVIAHEWGHQVLEHPKHLPVHPDQPVDSFSLQLSRQNEREADAYAAKFMAKHEYNVKPFVDYLKRAPQSNAHFFNKSTHDSVLARAAHIEKIYNETLNQKPDPNNPEKTNPQKNNEKPGAILSVPANFDLGEIKIGKTTRKLEIKNSGTSELRITSVRSTCGCATASVSKTALAPEESAEILFDVNRTEKSKKKIFTLYIISNDSEKKIRKVTLTAKFI